MTPLAQAVADLLTPFTKPQTAPARIILGLAGAPGAGKSTAADVIRRTAEDAGVSCVVVGMDGWHLAHSVLEARGQTDIKGAPETFDAHGFVDAVRRVRRQSPGAPTVWLPQFRREIEDAIAGAIDVRGEHQLVVVEGNYLLLNEAPWNELRDLFEVAWLLTPREELRQERLIARHEQHGNTADEARRRALGSDEHNARRVVENSAENIEETGVLCVDPG